MQEVMKKAYELAVAIRDSEINTRMKEAEKASENNEEAAKAVALYMEKRSAVEQLVASQSDDDRKALMEAAVELEKAEAAMNGQSVIHEMQEARKAFTDMMESVNRVLKLVITDDLSTAPASGCTGSCATCGGCGNKG